MTPTGQQAFAHSDDIAVDKFAAAMKAKMAKQRARGYSGWDDKEDCPTERLQQMLMDHIAKGDPVDIGNFAMMLFNRGEGTAANAVSEPVGINGLTESETNATMSVMGLSKPKKPTSYERKCFNDWKNS